MLSMREVRYLTEKSADTIAEGPCNGPNLTRLSEDYSLRLEWHPGRCGHRLTVIWALSRFLSAVGLLSPCGSLCPHIVSHGAARGMSRELVWQIMQ
jgi:hypothetical protein